MRIGIGYDIHRLVEGRKLILGGVEIPHEKGLMGHSDADVILHAAGDAMLGAIGSGDIGTHFPNTDPRYKNASSIGLLKKVNNIISKAGYRVNNIDCVLSCENPKLTPFMDEMKENISKALGIEKKNIGIKATTNEGIGAIGKGEAIAAYAVVCVEKK